VGIIVRYGIEKAQVTGSQIRQVSRIPTDATGGIGGSDGLYKAGLDAINRTNALSLFPRLARND
jgi:hypothetical protein